MKNCFYLFEITVTADIVCKRKKRQRLMTMDDEMETDDNSHDEDPSTSQDWNITGGILPLATT